MSEAESVIQELVITIVAAGIGILFAAWLGSLTYFKQKEYELVKERYLEGAIDVVASEIDQTFEVSKHNWARCLNIMKAFRDEKKAFDLKELSIGFRDMELALHQIAHHRIGECWCNACCHHAVLETTALIDRLGRDQGVPGVADHAYCGNCGSREVETRPNWPTVGVVAQHSPNTSRSL